MKRSVCVKKDGMEDCVIKIYKRLGIKEKLEVKVVIFRK
jgi:hypothetical protein